MFDVGFIQWLQSFSSPVLDRFFLLITSLGSHYFYMLILPFVYWAIDRKVGRQLAGLLLTSMWLNGFIKEVLVLPRPSPEDVRVLVSEPSPSFPSGHAQGAMTLWGYLAAAFRRRWLTWTCVVIIALVAISRVYLGAHFLGDVVGGLAIGGVLLLGMLWLTKRGFGRNLSLRMKMLISLVVPLALYPLYQSSTQELLIGFFIGLFTADLLSENVTPFNPRVPWKQQVAKLFIGYAGFVVLMALHMRYVPIGLPGVFGYSLLAVWTTLGAPAVFRKLGLDGNAPKPHLDATLRHHLRHYSWTVVGVVVLIAASSVYVNVAVPVAKPPAFLEKDGILVIGHRGAAGLAPENTIVGFETALAHGVDALELDVHATRDGHVVVLHDATVDRTTNGTGRIADLTLAEAQSLDAGYRFTPDGGTTYPWRGRGVTIPTLREVLSAFPDTPLIIEMKPSDPSFVDAVVQVVRDAGATGRVLLASFHDHMVQRVRQIAPEIATSYGRGEVTRLVVLQRLGLSAFTTAKAEALQVPERQGIIPVVGPGLKRVARESGLKLQVWTVNDEAAMRRLIALEVDGIITDYPNRLQHALQLLSDFDAAGVIY